MPGSWLDATVKFQMTLDSRLHCEWIMMSAVAGGMADMWIVDTVLCSNF